MIQIDARVMTHFQLNIFPTYKPSVDSRLTKAGNLVERKPYKISMRAESEEELVSY